MKNSIIEIQYITNFAIIVRFIDDCVILSLILITRRFEISKSQKRKTIDFFFFFFTIFFN